MRRAGEGPATASAVASLLSASALCTSMLFPASLRAAELDGSGPPAVPRARYEGFAAFRAAQLPEGALPVARLRREPADYVFLLPAGSKPPSARALPGGGPWRTGRLLVDVGGAAPLDEAARRLAVDVGVDFVRALGVGRWALFDAREPGAVSSALLRLGASAAVRRVEAELLRRLDVRSPFDDVLFPLQWHLENTGQRALPRMSSGADVKARQAWQITTGDPDVIIAVIDTGQDLGHPDFDDPGKMVAPLDTTDLSTDPSPEPFESSGAHGIACAGLAAASRTGTVGTVGVCPDCGVMPIRIFDDAGFTTDTSVVDAFVHARAEGASIVSNSWGYAPQILPAAVLDALAAFVDEARGGLGGVVLFAIGNSYAEVAASEIAVDPRVLAVGGTGADDERVLYSTFGEGIDLVAPTGHDFDFDGQGGFVLVGPQLITTDRPGDDGFNPPFDDFVDPGVVVDLDYTATMSGTSGACPIAAGVAGLVLSVRPDLRYEQVFALLRDHAEKVGPVTYDARGWHPEYGFGRVDAFRAVLAAATDEVCAPADESCADGVDNDCDGSVDDEDEDCGFELPPPDAPVGAACNVNDPEACGDGFCWTFVASGEGVCALTCLGGVCPEGSLCVSTDDAWGDYPFCFQTCTDDGDCAPGAACIEAAEGRVCHPLCGLPAGTLCPDGLSCEGEGAPCQGEPQRPVDAGPGPEPVPDDDGGVIGALDAGTGAQRPRKTDRIRIAAVDGCGVMAGATSTSWLLVGLVAALAATRRSRRRGP